MRKLIKEANKHEIPSGTLSDQGHRVLEIRNWITPPLPPPLGHFWCMSLDGAGLFGPVLPACVQTLQLAQSV